MIVIAESGSTKTHWVIVDNGKELKTFNSLGINPYTQKPAEIEAIIEIEVALPLAAYNIEALYFYGASCSSEDNCNIVRNAIAKFSHIQNIYVEHDVMAAALGLFGRESGIACILGTGSNSCFFDGTSLYQEVPALGYILGDEGSGASLGKRLLRDYLYLNLPKHLEHQLKLQFNLNKELVLNKVYKEQAPNRWLASFAPFIKANIHEKYCEDIVRESFRDFFRYHICCFDNYKQLPIGVVGSIGFFFYNILEEVSIEFETHLKKVIQTPLEGLIAHHTYNI